MSDTMDEREDYWKARAAAAEAALAAVPVDALLRYLGFPVGERRYSKIQEEDDSDAIREWIAAKLAPQPEVHP